MAEPGDPGRAMSEPGALYILEPGERPPAPPPDPWQLELHALGEASRGLAVLERGLAGLDRSARSRVLRWAGNRFAALEHASGADELPF